MVKTKNVITICPHTSKRHWDTLEGVIEIIESIGEGEEFSPGEVWRRFTREQWWTSPGFVSSTISELVYHGLLVRINESEYKNKARYRKVNYEVDGRSVPSKDQLLMCGFCSRRRGRNTMCPYPAQ